MGRDRKNNFKYFFDAPEVTVIHLQLRSRAFPFLKARNRFIQREDGEPGLVAASALNCMPSNAGAYLPRRYLSDGCICESIDTAVRASLLLKDSNNKVSYDRTSWYAMAVFYSYRQNS